MDRCLTEDSENCKLELKYAKQKGVAILPVKMQSGWTASEWLGIVTAGALWTPMHEETTMQRNVQGLVDQIKLAVPTVAVTTSTKMHTAAVVADG